MIHIVRQIHGQNCETVLLFVVKKILCYEFTQKHLTFRGQTSTRSGPQQTHMCLSPLSK